MAGSAFSTERSASWRPFSRVTAARSRPAKGLLDSYLPAISPEALMHKSRREALHNPFGDIVFFQLFKLELDRAGRFAFGIYGCHQIAVNIRLGRLRTAGVVGKRIALGARRSDDPAGNDAAVRVPVIRVVGAFHEEVRVTGENVDVLVGVILQFQQHQVSLAPALCARRA